MQDLEKLIHKKFNAEIRALQLKHRQEIESLKDRQAKLLNDVSSLVECNPEIYASFFKAIQ
jgi:hypothetical protein